MGTGGERHSTLGSESVAASGTHAVFALSRRAPGHPASGTRPRVGVAKFDGPTAATADERERATAGEPGATGDRRRLEESSSGGHRRRFGGRMVAVTVATRGTYATGRSACVDVELFWSTT